MVPGWYDHYLEKGKNEIIHIQVGNWIQNFSMWGRAFWPWLKSRDVVK